MLRQDLSMSDIQLSRVPLFLSKFVGHGRLHHGIWISVRDYTHDQGALEASPFVYAAMSKPGTGLQ